MKRLLLALPIVLSCKQSPSGASSGSSTGPAPLAPRASDYLGRPIAQPMSYAGADWLDRPDREAREQPEHVLDVLGVKEGMVVADVGAGTGYFTLRIARRVGARGHVYATDLQPEMLEMLAKKAGTDAVIETRLSTPADARLPKAALDLVLMVDVYHELPYPAETMTQVRDALKPAGRVALVEYRLEDPNVAIKTEHKMALPQIQKEMAAAHFTFVMSDESLPEQRIVTFSK